MERRNVPEQDIEKTVRNALLQFYWEGRMEEIAPHIYVYEAVKAEMEVPSKLLEHIGGRIVKRLFGDFPQIENIELKLSKRNPPMGADIEAAGIEICISREATAIAT